MRDETEAIIVSLTDLSEAIRATPNSADAPLAGLAAECAGSSRDELPGALALAKETAEESGHAAADLDEAAGSAIGLGSPVAVGQAKGGHGPAGAPPARQPLSDVSRDQAYIVDRDLRLFWGAIHPDRLYPLDEQ